MWQLCAKMMSWVQWWVELVGYSNRLSATRYMKGKRMGMIEILGGIWLFSANEMKMSETFSKEPTQVIVEIIFSLRHIIVTKCFYHWDTSTSGNFYCCSKNGCERCFFLMCESCHLDRASNFELVVKCPNVYLLFCLHLDWKEGQSALQFS